MTEIIDGQTYEFSFTATARSAGSKWWHLDNDDGMVAELTLSEVLWMNPERVIKSFEYGDTICHVSTGLTMVLGPSGHIVTDPGTENYVTKGHVYPILGNELNTFYEPNWTRV